MTLGLWVKNYLYIPMGGNRCGELKKMRNLFVSMLIIGLWHGAGWTFVIWGGMHGVLLMINHAWRKVGISLPKTLSWAMTFFSVVICWVFFRAGNFSDALVVLRSMMDIHSVINIDLNGSKRLVELMVIVLALTVIPNPLVVMKKFTPNNKWLVTISLLLLISLYRIAMAGTGEFLYFQF